MAQTGEITCPQFTDIVLTEGYVAEKCWLLIPSSHSMKPLPEFTTGAVL